MATWKVLLDIKRIKYEHIISTGKKEPTKNIFSLDNNYSATTISIHFLAIWLTILNQVTLGNNISSNRVAKRVLNSLENVPPGRKSKLMHFVNNRSYLESDQNVEENELVPEWISLDFYLPILE